jgi:hypothetical protein
VNLSTTIRVAEGPLYVTVLGIADRTFASIDLTDLSDIRLYGAADCDRLIIAATTAKRMLEMASRPHGYERAAGGPHCARCGQMQNRDIHEMTGPCACSHARDSHWEHAEPEGPRQGCAVLGCKCRMYGEYEAPVAGADVLLAAAELDIEMREPETGAAR